MINVAVCDDNILIASQMEEDIIQICREKNIPVNIDVFYSGNSIEKEVLQGGNYDLIYMDIQMDNGDGITAAKNIRKVDTNVLFIYVSGYEKYYIELFRLEVFAFILKPINREEFKKLFLEANLKICNSLFYYSFRYKNEEFKVNCMDVLYFESKGRKIYVHTRNDDMLMFNGKLSDVESHLSNSKIPFLRIHQSFLVNYHHVKSRTKTDVILINGDILSISEDRQKIFNKEYSKLLRGDIDV